ncbi:hypothetical protein PtA15_11A156 [Puccinia triticina]|uniref:Yeast cell wall synthesis Kre9/Knh1-like N-terminal domain-containing protein n=1 Tax=Puccinia triticina TaxID=208348 RepID=A0ABY7CYF1_9BASI|nr:uncharacterized protein PtA15_11A156 [Puccinia triticina]WAQ89467.1 hypothetical protein PtA15_11A156 [Puccinia triticina]
MLSSNVLVCLTPVFFGGFMALKVTSPNEGAAWNLQQTNTVTWTSVGTDPASFDIVLVNNNANCSPTGMSQMIKQNVASAQGKYDMSGVASVKACGGYQINLVATNAPGSHNTGILAQSAPFNVTQGAGAPVPGPNAVNPSPVDPAPGTDTPGFASLNAVSIQKLVTSMLLPASLLLL